MGRLHHQDFYGWTQDQADALRRRSVNEIDWDNLLAEIEDLGRSERRELRSRLALVIQHLLKWRVQSERRSMSWATTIAEQRDQIRDLLADNPSLVSGLDEAMAKAYRTGVSEAVAETGLSTAAFQATGPITFEDVMSATLEDDQDD